MGLINTILEIKNAFPKKQKRKKSSRKRKTKKGSRKTPKKTKSKKKVKSKKPTKSAKKEMPLVGEITHYFPKVSAGVVLVKKPFSAGNKILIKGATTNFKQRIKSLQINHIPIETAKKGEEVGMEVINDVRQGDKVFLL